MRFLKCLSLFVLFIGVFTVSFAFPSFAKDYGTVYPPYLNQSSGAFVECQTNVGKATILMPVDYRFASIGFYGNDFNLMNITNSTISCQLVLENGTYYTCRASKYSTFQYRYDDYNTYYDLTINQILNTNVNLSDDKIDRANYISDFSSFEVFVMSLFLLLFLISLISVFIRRSY